MDRLCFIVAWFGISVNSEVFFSPEIIRLCPLRFYMFSVRVFPPGMVGLFPWLGLSVISVGIFPPGMVLVCPLVEAFCSISRRFASAMVHLYSLVWVCR